MTTDFAIESYRSDAIQTAESVFDTLLRTPIELSPTAEPPAGNVLTAAVHYAGNWQGAFLVECTERQAREWSARLMQCEDVSESDARDGLGEVANVLAGNLKPLLPPGIGISLPCVVKGTDYCVSLCGGNQIERIDFNDASGPFRIILVKGADSFRPKSV